MNLSRYSAELQSVLRIVVGLLFMSFGAMLLFAFPAAPPGAPGPMPLTSQMGVGGILEFVGGLLLVAGFWTRTTSFVLSGMMAVAYFQFHMMKGGFWPSTNGGANAALFCFVCLYFAAVGAGPWSVDAMMDKKAKLG